MPVDMEKWSQLGSLKDLRKDFDDTPKGKRLRSLKLEEVVSVAQVRHIFTGLEELAESMKEVGQQSPIVVRPKNADGKFVILQGERRWRAARLAGFKRIDAIVVEGEVETQERILGQLTENIQRDDMRPLEIAAGIKELLDAGLKGKEVAAKLGRKPSYVVLYRDLLDLPEMVRQLAVQDKIKDATTLQILKKIYFARPDIAEELIREHLDDDGGMTRTMARSLLSRCQQPKEEPKPELAPSDDSATKKKASPYDVIPKQEEKEEEPADADPDDVEVEDEGFDEGEESGTDEPRFPSSTSTVRHKLRNEGEEISPEDFELPSAENTLPAGGRRVQPAQVNIKLSIIDESSNDVLYGILVPDVVSDDPSEICVFSNGRHMFWPVSQVHIESVAELKDETLAGW